MKKFICLLILFSCTFQSNKEPISKKELFTTNAFSNIHKDIPKPLIPEDNPITDEKIDLGRYLFYEKKLSIDNKFSCATCHEQTRAFTENKKVAIGVLGHSHTKNSMSLTNVGYNSILTWANSNLSKLEIQMLLPMFGESPPELAMSGKEDELIKKLEKEILYQKKFKEAFPNSNNPINIENITKAIASFERSLVSFNSPYDKYIYEKNKDAISDSAKKGERLFFSEKLECFHCHGGFNFSDSTKHERSAFIEFNLHNNGLYNLNNNGDYPKGGQGFFDISHNKKDMGKFKAPTLRNIEVTSPYMHDGSISTLEDVIDHYSKGGRTIASGEFLGDGSKNPYKSGFVKGFTLSDEEKQDLLEFLKSLTDRDFLSNSKYSDPFKK
ncbi:MAG: MbnH family di-heme enzyme [Cyanobacteriota bacterium]